MQFIFVFVVFVVLAVVLVMLAARLVGAGRVGFGSALVAVILQNALSAATQTFAPNLGVALLVAIVAGSANYAFILDTTLIKGFLIGIVSAAIGIVVIVILGNRVTAGAIAI